MKERKTRKHGLGCSIALAVLLIGSVGAVVALGPRLLDLLNTQTDVVLSAAQNEGTAQEQLIAQREEAVAQLNSYGWVNETSGVARIPIERAMALIAEIGLPVGTTAIAATEVSDTGASGTGTTTLPPVGTSTLPVALEKVNFKADVLPILKERCAECHGDEEPDEDLMLTSYGNVMYGSLNGSVVEPSDSANSFLVEQIISGQMPKRRDPLPQSEIDIIVAWIDEGALNEEPSEVPEPSAANEPAAEAAVEEVSVDLTNVSFKADVLPIFKEHCTECHGFDYPEDELQLGSYSDVLYGSKNGAVVEPGDPENSFLVEQIINGQMPKRRDPLAQSEIDIIVAWIDQGALNE